MEKVEYIPPNDIDNLTEEARRGRDRDVNFRRIFESYYRPVFRFFEKRNFPAPESHDLTQETFIRVYNGMGSFRGDAPFEAWMFQVAANVFRNTLRERAAQKRAGHHLSLVTPAEDAERDAISETNLIDREGRDPLDEVLQEERIAKLREAIASLPEQMRRCVMLRVYQELSYGEIAVVMHLSVETVKSHLHQARRQLRIKLSDYFDVPSL
jgi:RNA polymerase sigma-70 factor (ECF subfamily)